VWILVVGTYTFTGKHCLYLRGALADSVSPFSFRIASSVQHGVLLPLSLFDLECTDPPHAITNVSSHTSNFNGLLHRQSPDYDLDHETILVLGASLSSTSFDVCPAFSGRRICLERAAHRGYSIMRGEWTRVVLNAVKAAVERLGGTVVDRVEKANWLVVDTREAFAFSKVRTLSNQVHLSQSFQADFLRSLCRPSHILRISSSERFLTSSPRSVRDPIPFLAPIECVPFLTSPIFSFYVDEADGSSHSPSRTCFTSQAFREIPTLSMDPSTPTTSISTQSTPTTIEITFVPSSRSSAVVFWSLTTTIRLLAAP